MALPFTVLAVVSVTSPASTDDNGVGLTPAMGWSSWSFLRHDPTEASIKAEARALRQTGRPIHLELANSLNIIYASMWERGRTPTAPTWSRCSPRVRWPCESRETGTPSR